jgi:hypothetical protein
MARLQASCEPQLPDTVLHGGAGQGSTRPAPPFVAMPFFLATLLMYAWP